MTNRLHLGSIMPAKPISAFLPRYRLLLILCLIFSVKMVQGQPETIILSIQGIQGVQQGVRGETEQIYTVQLRDNDNNLTDNSLGFAGNVGIQITLSDLTTPTGILASDLGDLTLYRSDNTVVDAGDIVIDTQTATIGSVIQFNAFVAPALDRIIPEGATSRYFIVTAVISPTARLGGGFRLAAGLAHIGIEETVFPPLNSGSIPTALGQTIIASDANHVSIGDGATSGGVPVTIPFGGEAAILLLLIGTGVYALRRTT